MVLTNAERQARYRQRLKDAARAGVTQDDVIRATRLMFEWHLRDDPSLPYEGWDDFAAKMAKAQRDHGMWTQWVPNDIEDDYAEFGDDAELMRSVARVAHAVLHAPGWKRPKVGGK